MTDTPDAAIAIETPPGPQAAMAATDLLEALASPAVIFDGHGIVLHANGAARRAFPGLDAGIVLRHLFRDAALNDAFDAVLAGRPAVAAAYVERRPQERAYKVEVSPVRAGVRAGLAVFIDQTEALLVDRMRADFIANASHELRTPLTAVSGFLETLQGPAKNDPVNRERFIALMLEQSQRMARLLDDLLSLSRLESRTAPDKTEPVDLGRLLAATVAALGNLTRQHEVTVNLHVAVGEVVIEGNRDELTQVFQNLIENACKYAASGRRIDISPVASARREIGIAIRDHGAGIEPEHIPRLTERFYRVNVQESRQQKGTGLGLAIVKHILQRHRARLQIESRRGEGSTFTVFFPGDATVSEKVDKN